ncbi:hypothetical protein BKA70DRAFT_1287686 [Coprinopsis sp. MPI-PUGE-AT-0042]|nr:hypothetical protein BKA70DRAFT_1287686 [Coprinopsis sp. MPI-PUGE-AT-0042]
MSDLVTMTAKGHPKSRLQNHFPATLTAAVMKHDKFFREMAVFKVEDVLFQLDRSRLEALSPVFRDMFSVPPPAAESGAGIEGASEANPIVLEGYKSVDFERLVSLIYPCDDYIPGDPLPITTKEEWISVLKLSSIWEMDKLKKMSIDHLSKLPVPEVEKVKLGREHQVMHWVSEGVKAIASAGSIDAYPMSDMVEKLGWEASAKILWIRGKMSRAVKNDKFVVDLTKITCHTPGCLRQLRMEQMVCEGGHKATEVKGIVTGAALRTTRPLTKEDWAKQIKEVFPE